MSTAMEKQIRQRKLKAGKRSKWLTGSRFKLSLVAAEPSASSPP
jgi:hypothetical protein